MPVQPEQTEQHNGIVHWIQPALLVGWMVFTVNAKCGQDARIASQEREIQEIRAIQQKQAGKMQE